MNKLQLYKSARIHRRPLTMGQTFVAAPVGIVRVCGSADNPSRLCSHFQHKWPQICGVFFGFVSPWFCLYLTHLIFSWVKSDLFTCHLSCFQMWHSLLLNVLTVTRPLWNLIRLLRRSRSTFHLILSRKSSWRDVPDKKYKRLLPPQLPFWPTSCLLWWCAVCDVIVIIQAVRRCPAIKGLCTEMKLGLLYLKGIVSSK